MRKRNLYIIAFGFMLVLGVLLPHRAVKTSRHGAIETPMHVAYMAASFTIPRTVIRWSDVNNQWTRSETVIPLQRLTIPVHKRPKVVVPPTPPASPPPSSPPPPPPPASSPPPAPGVWAELRQCESSDNYSTNTGNGYYGAYQFALSTWYSLGETGLPSNAPPAVQDAAAQRLQAIAGWGQWPVCSQKLSL